MKHGGATLPVHRAGSLDGVAVLLLFAMAREAAGTNRVSVDGATVGDVIDAAIERFGDRLREVVPHCKVWRNGEPANRDTPVGPADEVALLPPVSGGCGTDVASAAIQSVGTRGGLGPSVQQRSRHHSSTHRHECSDARCSDGLRGIPSVGRSGDGRGQ